MKKSLVRSGCTALALMVVVLSIPFIGAWVDPDVKPIVTYGKVITIEGLAFALHADDGYDIEIRLETDSSLPYVGEHGAFYYVPASKRIGTYKLLGVRDFDPSDRPPNYANGSNYVDHRAKWNRETRNYDCPTGFEASGWWNSTGDFAQVECVPHCEIFDCEERSSSRKSNRPAKSIYNNVIEESSRKENDAKTR